MVDGVTDVVDALPVVFGMIFWLYVIYAIVCAVFAVFRD